MTDRPEEHVPMATPIAAISRPKRQRVCLRLCHRYRYDDADIEDLYDRYVFHLQRTSLQCLLVLLIAYCASIAILDGIFVARATVENISHLSMGAVFLILLIFMHTRLMTYSQIPIAGYLVAFLCSCLAAVAMPVNYMDSKLWKFTAVDGVWRLFYLIIAIYAFLPLRICVGILAGLALPSAHTALCILMPVSYPWLLWRQLTANAILFIAVNIVGIYIHDCREHAQRKVFSNIRACVAGRMHKEDENEKLEKMLHSILPSNIAMEMKNDVKHPRDDVVLQNVYAQKHNSVSILFADISGFSALVPQCSAHEIVQVFNEIMGKFDQLAGENHCVRVRLHGDGYFAVCGVPDARPDHAKCCVELGLDMTHVIGMVREATDMDIGLRVGVHSGNVLCGVIGTKKWQYDVWSDDVQVAKQLETSGMPGRVHVSHATVEYLHGEFGVEALPGPEQHRESYLIVADHPRRNSTLTFNRSQARHSRVSLASSKLNGGQSVLSLVKAVVKSNCDVPLSTILLGQKDDKQSKKNVTDKMLRPFKRSDRAPSDRVELYLASAIDTNSIDKMKTDHVNYVSLKFKNHAKERRYLRQDDSSFPTVMLLSLIMLVLSSALQALVLPRTLLLILLFIVSFSWVAVILILLLGSRLKCIGCDLQESAILRVLIMTVTILFVYSVSQVNVLCCNGGVFFSLNHTVDISVIAFNQNYHLKCEMPQYIYLSGIMGYLLICIFMKLTSLAKVLLMLFVAGGYVAVMEYTHQSIFKAMDTIMRPPVPTDVVGILGLVHCLVLLFVHAREFEWIHRLAFLWKDQAREERDETMDMQLVNRRLLGNVLPVHVALFYLDPLQLNRESLDIYCRPYSRVGFMFASIPNFSEFYSQMDSNSRGADSLKVLNDIIGDFDELLDQDHFKAVEKLKTMGTCYMAAIGLHPERVIHETEQSTALHLSVLVEFVTAMREKLEINNNSYGTRFQLRVGINVGPVVAGVVGAKRPQFDVYGQAVNIASLMESRGQPAYTQVTDAVYRPLRDRYQFQCRGPTQINNRSEILTYFLLGRNVGYRPELHVSMIESMTESQMDELPRDLGLILPVMGSSDKIRLLESQDMARSSPKTAPVREGSIRSNTSASGSIGSHGMPHNVPGIQIRARIDENAPLITKNTPPGSLNRKRRNSGCRESSRKTSGSSLTNFLQLPQVDPNHMRVESPDLPLVHYRNTAMPGGNICRSESMNSGGKPQNLQLTQSQILSMGMMTPPPLSPTEDRATPRGGTPSTGRSSVASVISIKARESPQRLTYSNGSSDPNLNRSGSNGALANPIYVNAKSASMNSSNSFVLPCIDETSESKSCSDGGVSSPNSGELLGREFDELNKIMKELDRKGLKTPQEDSDSTLNGYSHHNKAYSRYSPVVINGRTPKTSTNSPLHPPVAASSVEVKNAPLVTLMARHHSFPDQTENGQVAYKKQNSAPSGISTNGVSKVVELPKEEEEENRPSFMLGPGQYDTASSCATKYDNASSTSGTGKFDTASIDYLKYRLKESADESDRSPPPLPPPPPDDFFVPDYSFQLQAAPTAQAKKKQNDLSQHQSAFQPPDKKIAAQKKVTQKNIPSQHLLEVPKIKPNKGKNKVVKDKKHVFTPPYNIVTGELVNSKPIQKKGNPPYRRADQTKPQEKPVPSPQQAKRRHLTKTPPRHCRSLERLSGDLNEGASRESSRAQSPKDGKEKPGHYDFYLPFGATKSHLLPDNISLSSIGSSEMSKSDPALNYDSGSTAYESEYDNYRPGMASDEDYFVPDEISDIDIDIFDELNVDDVEISDKYSIDLPMPHPIRQKIITDV